MSYGKVNMLVITAENFITISFGIFAVFAGLISVFFFGEI